MEQITLHASVWSTLLNVPENDSQRITKSMAAEYSQLKTEIHPLRRMIKDVIDAKVATA